MGSLSNYMENEILDHITGKGSFTMVSPVYVGLWTSTLDDTSTGSTAGECSGGSYARVATGASHWNAAASGAADNASAITFPTASGSWGTVTYFALLDANATGNILVWGAVSPTKSVGSGDTASFDAGALDITID